LNTNAGSHNGNQGQDGEFKGQEKSWQWGVLKRQKVSTKRPLGIMHLKKEKE